MNINNPKIWSITDGSQGMISQTKGLSFELSNNVIEIETKIIFPWSKIQPGILPIFKWIFRNKIPEKDLPKIIISCGRKSVYLSMYLKKKYPKIINIHIQNPKVSNKNFSLIVAPNHDNYKGENIINSVGALHPFKSNDNSKINYDVNNARIVSCIIGGENNHYKFSENEANELCNKIIRLKKNNKELQFLVITSRRTSDKIKMLLYNKISSFAELWLGKGENPYNFALFNSEYFIITSDSTSMISEATISGKPIYVYKLPLKRKSHRINRFHDEFKNLNITRDLLLTDRLDSWTYTKLNESKRIAGIIKERIIEGIDESR